MRTYCMGSSSSYSRQSQAPPYRTSEASEPSAPFHPKNTALYTFLRITGPLHPVLHFPPISRFHFSGSFLSGPLTARESNLSFPDSSHETKNTCIIPDDTYCTSPILLNIYSGIILSYSFRCGQPQTSIHSKFCITLQLTYIFLFIILYYIYKYTCF